MRKALRNFYLSSAGYFKKPSSRTHFLNGHFVVPNDAPREIQMDILYKQLRALSQYCQLVDPEEATAHLHQNSEPLVSLTFDDGYDDMYYVVAPVLAQLNIKAILFINPSFLGMDKEATRAVLRKNYETPISKMFLTKDMVAALHREGHAIGSHSSSHQRLNISDEDTLKSEIVESKIEIEKIIQDKCIHFAYPFGGSNDLSKEALDLAMQNYSFVYSSIKQEGLWSFNGKIINRRHFEGNWPVSHIKYFLSNRN